MPNYDSYPVEHGRLFSTPIRSHCSQEYGRGFKVAGVVHSTCSFSHNKSMTDPFVQSKRPSDNSIARSVCVG